ncbi:biopolymer transporter ExbD [bacterium]|jgi:biopolymer transport protein ExbD|nr:biopolymer transporter ExbD [bacterium]NSX01346.1 biopolymer transporter ExbD [Deltaproteobacteria bacterium TMED58]RZP16470.1 MAG: biopolymer transporter ExbD [Candidatus Dadabacteria bacterium]|tara:strand:+ start:4948 stop:5346 length:399 start_codon:yes stop_codon:yes gene_type:complete
MNFNKRINIEDSLMDLTPIVDVVFNLLIFFALSLNFSQVVSSINIKLPKAKSSEVVTEKQVVVSIERNNKVYINDQALYLDQIPNYLDKINKDNVVVVKADKEIDHGFVVQIMDLIKRSGFKKLGIAVTKQE